MFDTIEFHLSLRANELSQEFPYIGHIVDLQFCVIFTCRAGSSVIYIYIYKIVLYSRSLFFTYFIYGNVCHLIPNSSFTPT